MVNARRQRERVGLRLDDRAEVVGRLADRLLEQREQQLVLAVEVLVEAAQRLLRPVDHLLDRELGRALLVDELERGVEEPLDALLGPRPGGVQAARDRPLAPRGLGHVLGCLDVRPSQEARFPLSNRTSALAADRPSRDVHAPLWTRPPFITKRTSWVTVMSSVGSPGTAMMSASRPGASRPRSSTSMSSALDTVAARSACAGRHAAVDHRPQLLGVVAVGDRGRVGAARDLHAGRDRLPEHGARPREHLGRLRLQLGCRPRHVEPLGQVAGRDEERAVLDHHPDRVVARERAVLDAVDARRDAGADAGVTVRVGRDLEPGAVRLVDDRRELLVGVLLRAREPAVRHDAARRRDLDEPGAVLDLVADRLADLGHAVGDALLDGERHDVGRRGAGTSSDRGGRPSG